MSGKKNSGTNNPSDFLKTVLGRPVVVKLNSGVDYRGVLAAPRSRLPPRCRHPTRRERRSRPRAGVLACLDSYMNIAMEQTEEYVNGQLKAKYGDTFIRGNNGVASLPRTCAPTCRRRALLTRRRAPCAAVLYISTQKARKA